MKWSIGAFLTLILCLSVLNCSASSSVNKTIAVYGAISYGAATPYTNVFHTGAPASDYLSTSSDYYHTWDAARPYVKYALIQGAAILSDDGSITPTMYLDVSWTGITNWLSLIYGNNDYPILEFWMTNIATVTDSGLNAFLTRLSSMVGNRSLIFDCCFEYNFPSYMNTTAWGDKGDGTSFYVPPTLYNTVMHRIRSILDQHGITNILLASHANMLISVYQSGQWHDNPNYDGVLEYLDGMRQADVVGFSHYNTNLAVSWPRAKAIYDMIGTAKPCLFFEYAPDSPWQTNLNVTAEFVNASYAMLRTYPFIKGFNWYFGSYCTNDTMLAIKQNAETYEGWS